MPSPPTTIAMRGAFGLPAIRLDRARIDVGRARAVVRDLRDRAVARRLRAALVVGRARRLAVGRRARRSTTSWRLPLVPSMMVTVLPAGRRLRRLGGRRLAAGWARPFRRPAGVAGRPRLRRRLAGAAGRRDHRDRLAAERIVDEHGPADEHRPGTGPAAPAIDRGTSGTGSRRPLLAGLSWPSGVFRSSVATARSPRESSSRESSTATHESLTDAFTRRYAALRSRPPKTNGAARRPPRMTIDDVATAQFGTARLRIRREGRVASGCRASGRAPVCSALSSFGSGGM